MGMEVPVGLKVRGRPFLELCAVFCSGVRRE